MKFQKPKYEKPINGIALVRLGDKKKFTLDVTYKNEKGKEDNDKFSFTRDDLPDNLPEGFELKNGKSYFVSIRADGSGINQLRPAKGMFTVKSPGFARNEDDGILVIERKGDYGKYWQIVGNLEVISGDNEGVVYPLYLPLGQENSKGEPSYRFAPDDDGNFSVIGNPEKSKNVSALFDFLQYTGLADLEIPFPDTEDVQVVLTVLDKQIRKQKKTFTLIVEDGYPKTLASTDEDAEDEPDEKPVKKAKIRDDNEDTNGTSRRGEPVDDEEDEEEETPKRKKPKFDEDED